MDLIKMLDAISARILAITKENESLKTYLSMISTTCALEEDKEKAFDKIQEILAAANDTIVKGGEV